MLIWGNSLTSAKDKVRVLGYPMIYSNSYIRARYVGPMCVGYSCNQQWCFLQSTAPKASEDAGRCPLSLVPLTAGTQGILPTIYAGPMTHDR